MNSDERQNAVLSGLIVTIDGPAGSGKSATATSLAQRLGLMYLDTGAMYRAVTLAVIERGIDPQDEAGATAVAREIVIEQNFSAGKSTILLNGRAVEREIRTAAVSDSVSAVSLHPGVRRAMVAHQRAIGSRGGIVAEGRDTGSFVFPCAHVKIFLVADVETRAARRVLQLGEMGLAGKIEAIRNNLERRDALDSGRHHAPLVRPPGSYLIDTSSITLDEQVGMIEDIVRREVCRLVDLRVFPGERNRYGKMRRYYRLAWLLIRLCAKIIFGLRVYGSDHLRHREQYLFASNHVSYADPPLVGCALDREVWFLAKRELFRNRLFARLISAYHAVPIDRQELDRTTVRRIGGILDGGESVLMFPEGTRSSTGRLGAIKSGIGFMALRVRAAVVPVYISGSEALRDCILRRRKLEVRIGPPIRIPEDYKSQDRKRDYDLLASMIGQALEMLENESRT